MTVSLPTNMDKGFSVPESLLSTLTAEFTNEFTVGFLLTGSHARGDATPLSDIDLIRIVNGIPPGESEREIVRYRDGRLVSVAATTIKTLKNDMRQPKLAGWVVPALRQSRILADKDGSIADLKTAADE